MKKIVTSMMVMSVLSMSLYGYSQEDRLKDMQVMEAAMAQIQKGILSNNDTMVVEGVDNLKKATSNVEVAPKWKMDYSPSYAKQQTENILTYADKIKSSIAEDHKHSASKSYTKILNECISCHNKLRRWK